MNLQEAVVLGWALDAAKTDPEPEVTVQEFFEIHKRVTRLREKMTPAQRKAITDGAPIEEVIPEHADEFKALVFQLSSWGAEMFEF